MKSTGYCPNGKKVNKKREIKTGEVRPEVIENTPLVSLKGIKEALKNNHFFIYGNTAWPQGYFFLYC